jgi:DNA-binding transcriptional LysR family regulator
VADNLGDALRRPFVIVRADAEHHAVLRAMKPEVAVPPPWEQLASWIAVVETGAVSAAARRAGLSQAGVSQHVRALEQRLGCELLDRGTRPARVTASGRRLYEHALDLLQRANEMDEGVRSLSRSTRSAVRVGCVDSFAATLGPSLVRGLFDRVQRLQLLSGLMPDLAQRFAERRLDLLIGTQDVAGQAGIDAQPLLAERFVLVLPRERGLRGATTLQALGATLPFFGYSMRSTIGAQVDAYVRRHDPGLTRRYEFDATDPLLGLVAAGLGFALTTPLCLWQSRHHAQAVQVLPLSTLKRDGEPYPLLERRFWLCNRAGELGRLPSETANLVRVAVRELKRALQPALGVEPAALVALHESRRNAG